MAEEAIDYEADFMKRAQVILEDTGIDNDVPEEEDEPIPQEESEEEDEAEEEEADEEPVAEEESEEDDEDLPKISLRIDGKKVDPAEVLKHMTFTPVVDGEEVEVDYDELVKGYQRGADYSKKTTELKRANEELLPYTQMVAYAKNDPKFLEHVEGYFTNGPDAQMNANPLVRVTDAQLADMMDTDSDNYDPKKAAEVVRARTEWQKQSIERQQVNQKVQAEKIQRYNQWAQEQITLAQQTIDGMAQEGEYAAKSESILAFLKDMGFNEAEISGQAPISATDARAAILAYKAAEYDRLIKEGEAPKVRLGKKRKRIAPPRSQASGTGKRTPSGSRARDNYRKAANSQKVDDWVNVIKKRMNLE